MASTGFAVLRPRAGVVDSRYLFHWVRSPSFIGEMTRRATGASYPAVSDRIVKASELPLPPIEEQRRIAAVLDQADELRSKRRDSFALVDSLNEAIFLDMFGDPAVNNRGYPTGPLGDIALKFSDGPFGSNLKSSHYVESGVRVVRLQNIGVGRFVDDDAAYISEDHFTALRKHECLPGDVLVGTLGDPNLRACTQPPWLQQALNKADCVQVRVDPSRATSGWLTALLNHPSTERLAQGLVLGQTRARISMGRLRTLVVPVPPIEDQRLFSLKTVAVERQRHRVGRSSEEFDGLFASLQHRAFAGTL
ncbi:MAG TPA: restriction endonuclease subunit S [Acidimicrobiales bacterium]|nr:restriction endonuclease subunit S [Acidimicrobiales bacterium]